MVAVDRSQVTHAFVKRAHKNGARGSSDPSRVR
jgi:hypothetical protein